MADPIRIHDSIRTILQAALPAAEVSEAFLPFDSRTSAYRIDTGKPSVVFRFSELNEWPIGSGFYKALLAVDIFAAGTAAESTSDSVVRAFGQSVTDGVCEVALAVQNTAESYDFDLKVRHVIITLRGVIIRQLPKEEK